MKRIVCFLIVLIALLCVVSCDKTYATVETEFPEYKQTKNYDIEIWTDEETGVQYIVYSNKTANAGMGGITPRLNADGTLYIGE